MGPNFRKSTYSDANGTCLETAFKKSSYSNTSGTCLEAAYKASSYSTGANNCLEAALPAGTVLVRDSKDITIPGLAFTPDAWVTFLATIKV
jgi:hypothetical protein